MLEYKTSEAIAFLKRLRPLGPWILTAIVPNKGNISTQTFTREQEEQMFAWVEQYQNIRNIYYTLNTVKGTVDSKPNKSLISELIALHCDCDPRVGEDLLEERDRILKLLRSFKPLPSIIVDSGAGYQAIFLLESSILLDCTIEMAEEYERYNRQLEILLSGDACFNIDRILRLPGTINVPDEKKLKKGRIAALSTIVEWNDFKYSLSDFVAAPTKIQSGVSTKSLNLPGGGERIKLSGNIAPLYVDNLDSKGILVNDHIKALIIHGENNEVKIYPSRSEALFAVACALIKAGATDDDVAGIILNKENKISESVLDKNRPEQYTAKQIQSAREELEDPALRRFNEKFCVIGDLGGRCRIISEAYDHALRRTRISFASFDDFKNRFCHERVKIGEDEHGKLIEKPAGHWWINNSKRRQYDTIVFVPGKEIPGAYNLWQGFSCEAIPGDCSLFLEHILLNLCSGNQIYYHYLLSWMARCVQQPDCSGEVAIVLQGDMGTGKSFFAKRFGNLFGRHFLQISDPKHLIGSFNSHLRDCVLLFGDEAFWAGDKKHESVLRSLITEENLAIEAKGVDLVSSPNYTHLVLASNADWVVPAGTNERRFFIVRVGQDKMQDKKYFAAIGKQMDTGGKEALLHFLLTYDIEDFEVRDIPRTEALQDQKVLSMTSEEVWWYEKLEEGRLLKTKDNWDCEVMKQDLQDDYVLFMQRVGLIKKASATVLGKFLAKVHPGGSPRSYQKMTRVTGIGTHGEIFSENRRMYFYEFAELVKCREHWDINHGSPFHWSVIMQKEEQMKLKGPEEAFK